MKKHTARFVLFITLLIAGLFTQAQQQIVVPNYTACPNEIVTVVSTWPNTSVNSMSLGISVGGQGQNNGQLGTNQTFTLSYPAPGVTEWTLSGTGTNINGPTTSTVKFYVTIVAPPTLTFANMVHNYCPGGTATIDATPGGNSYTAVGPGQLNFASQSNVITIPNLSPAHTGTYQVTSVGSCTAYGTFSLSVAPNVQLSANAGYNVCQGATNLFMSAQLSGGATAQNWNWQDPQGQSIFNGPGFNYPFASAPISINEQGTYTVSTEQIYYSSYDQQSPAICPKTATTFINVVETVPVTISPAPGSEVCQNGKLGLTAIVSKNISLSWTGPNGFSSTSGSPTISPVAPSNAGTYSVVALFTNNFTTCVTSSSINVTVVPVTVPVLNMPAEVCQGANIVLAATGGTNASSYEWFGPGLTMNGQAININNIQPGASGTYYVTAKYTGLSTVCPATSLPKQLLVVPVNTISVIPPKPVCQPDNASLSALSIGATSYQWAGPNNFSATGPNVTVYYPDLNASGQYTVTAFFGNGNIICKSVDYASLQVNPILKFSLVERQMACYNSSLEVNGPSGATSYTWTSSTGFASNSRDIKFPSIQPKNAGTYTLAVNLGPCVTSASTSIEVLSPISFTLRPQGRSICLGDTVTFEAGVTGGSENYAYAWNPPLYMDSPVGPFKQFVPLGTVNYNLVAHDIACPHYTVSHAFEVTVNRPPVPQLDLSATDGCAPLVLKMDPQIEKESAITTYDFGGTRQFQKEGAFTYTLAEPGSYNLSIYAKGYNGCLGKYDFPYPITVRPRPGSDIYWSPERPTTSDEITFYATAQYQPLIYQSWTFQGGVSTELPDSLISGTGVDTTNIATPRRKYEKFGKYPVMLVAQNDQMCFDTIVKFVDVIDDMNVYIPNAFTPNDDGVNDVFGVKGQGMKSEAFLMELRNRAGALMFTTKDINDKWDGTFRGQKVKDGIYTYLIRVVGMNGEGRKEYVGHFSLIR